MTGARWWLRREQLRVSEAPKRSHWMTNHLAYLPRFLKQAEQNP